MACQLIANHETQCPLMQASFLLTDAWKANGTAPAAWENSSAFALLLSGPRPSWVHPAMQRRCTVRHCRCSVTRFQRIQAAALPALA